MSELSEAAFAPDPDDSTATSSDAEPGGASAGDAGAPAGFTAQLPGTGGTPGMTDDPDAAREAAGAASHEHGSDLGTD